MPAALAAATLLWLYALLAGTPYQEAKALVMVAAVVAIVSIRALLASGATVLLAAGFLVAAGGSSALVLANGPVGPSGYSPQLAELRERLPEGSIEVRVPAELLDEQHAADYVAWELRGNRLCVEATAAAAPALGPGIAARVTIGLDGAGAIVADAVETAPRVPGPGPCPLIPDAARADPSAGG